MGNELSAYQHDKIVTTNPNELRYEYHEFYNHESHISNGDFLIEDCYKCLNDKCQACNGKVYKHDNSECPFCVNGRI